MYSTSLLKGLAAAGAISAMTARAVPDGFLLIVRVGLDTAPVKAYRGQARIFKKLDAVARYVRELGLVRFEVDLEGAEIGNLF